MKEKTLILRLKSGDRECFDQVFETFWSPCYSFAVALIKDKYAAQDIVQKVFLNLYVRRSELREDIPIKTWLLKAVRFEVLNWLKLHVNSRRERLSDAADPVSESSPYQDMCFNETNARISRAVASLPVKRRTVFLMSRIDNMSTEEIALATGLSPRTVEKHIELALKDLRRIIS